MDMATKKVEWHEAVFPGAYSYVGLHGGPNGLVYGMVDSARFFVFDPVQRKVVHEELAQPRFGSSASQQGPRIFVDTPKGDLYMLFQKGIVKVNRADHSLTLVAESPVLIGPGGDYLKGRIYFGSGSHVYSWGPVE